MRLLPDASIWQSGEGSGNNINVEAAAQSFPGMWMRFTDYSLYRRYGADAYYVDTIERFRAAGGYASGYLYPRPYMTDPVTQIDNWFNSSPEINLSPMLDPEGPGMGGMSGNTLTQWLDEALAQMAVRWPNWLPTLYTSAAFFSGYGVSRPSTPHILMLAEYHRGYQVFSWPTSDTWIPYALAAYGGPDMPPGYDRSELAVWQFTSSAQGPGFGGNIDMSMVWDWAWPALLGSAAPLPKKEDEDMVIRQFQTPDGTVWLAHGLLRTPLSDEGLRQSLLDTGQLDPNIVQINPWTLNALTVTTPAILVNMQGTMERAVGNVVAPVVGNAINGALASWKPPAPAPVSGNVDPTTMSSAQLSNLVSALVSELNRRLAVPAGPGPLQAPRGPQPPTTPAPTGSPLDQSTAAAKLGTTPPSPTQRMVASEPPSKMAGSTYHNAPVEPPSDEPTPPPPS